MKQKKFKKGAELRMITWAVLVATTAKHGNNFRVDNFLVPINIELKGLILSTPLVTFEANNGDASAISDIYKFSL